jgi:hypothetical protein
MRRGGSVRGVRIAQRGYQKNKGVIAHGGPN